MQQAGFDVGAGVIHKEIGGVLGKAVIFFRYQPAVFQEIPAIPDGFFVRIGSRSPVEPSAVASVRPIVEYDLSGLQFAGIDPKCGCVSHYSSLTCVKEMFSAIQGKKGIRGRKDPKGLTPGGRMG
jgi:hypothetical protein